MQWVYEVAVETDWHDAGSRHVTQRIAPPLKRFFHAFDDAVGGGRDGHVLHQKVDQG